MKILGIDTILHDVCVSVVEDGRFVLVDLSQSTLMNSDKMYQLVDIHLNQIGSVIEKALIKANSKIEDIDLISVNHFGSFISNVLIGLTAAETLARIFNKPLIQVHHQETHYFSNWVERDPQEFSFPILVLSSSGGHSGIIKILNNKFKWKELYRIDAMRKKGKDKPNFRGIGAIYSYLANALKIGGPIGSAPMIAKYARNGKSDRFDLISQLKKFDITKLDFSEVEKIISQVISQEKKISKKFISDLCASFEQSMAELITNGLLNLAQKEKVAEIHLVGGISANLKLKQVLKKECLKQGLKFKAPINKKYSVDNGAMIACLGYYKYINLSAQQKKKLLKNREIKFNSNLKLEKIALEQRIKNVIK